MDLSRKEESYAAVATQSPFLDEGIARRSCFFHTLVLRQGWLEGEECDEDACKKRHAMVSMVHHWSPHCLYTQPSRHTAEMSSPQVGGVGLPALAYSTANTIESGV